MSKRTVVTAPAATKPVVRTRKAARPYAALLTRALLGEFGSLIKLYYDSALDYHASRGTEFPRQKNQHVPLLTKVEAEQFLLRHAKTSIPPRDKLGQRLFDQMMAERAA